MRSEKDGIGLLAKLEYKYYKVEKAEGHIDKALAYLEQYNEASDSLMIIQNEENVIGAERDMSI